ncbi:MAG: hypothetical protein ACOH1Y_09895 [Propionicimonas sp.]
MMVLPTHGDLGEINPASDLCQRWTNRQHSWVRRSQGGFNPNRYTVTPIHEQVAKEFVVQHHYAGTYPAASRRYGLLQASDQALLGVAVFGIPAQAKVLTNVFPTLVPYVQSLELSRFVIEDDARGRAPGNTESWFLARCFELLAADGIRGIVSFADPVPRKVGGRLLFPGHVGTIYQASNALFTGRGTARTLTILPNGTSLSDRSLQKVRKTEQGHEYVERRLINAGAQPLRAGTTGASWLHDALNDAGALRLRHRGCLRYAMVTSHRDRNLIAVRSPALPYPKATDPT